MFCFQCQETAKNQGCTIKGVCGKPEETSDLQDLLIDVCEGISFFGRHLRKIETVNKKFGNFICQSLFVTITNAAWDDEAIIARIKEGLKIRDEIKKAFLDAHKKKYGKDFSEVLP
ncbi:MAG: hydroxylamine reductase, partial [Alphaproteobacteria bacterium]|nr:hydroxylamine reductase [Alphaproteobacteria bacterium]